MKTLFPFILLLLVSACNSSDDNVGAPAVPEKPIEELIGKTVDEYKEVVNEQDKPSEVKASDKPDTEVTESSTTPKETETTYGTEVEKGFVALKWEGLIAPGYDAESILEKYNPIISQLSEGSEEANQLYQEMQAEYNKAPPNESLANKKVSIPGFIAPLEQNNGVITEFLLVPYFGACIHQPAPPANQTVHVKTGSKSGIKTEDAYDPIWVSGELLIDSSTTDIGTASYKVQEAKIQKYDIEN